MHPSTQQVAVGTRVTKECMNWTTIPIGNRGEQSTMEITFNGTRQIAHPSRQRILQLPLAIGNKDMGSLNNYKYIRSGTA
jgi:hypothetical protein